jgi:hypothetical protein
MSYDIFKQNMLSYMRNQRAIGSKEDFAKKLVQEYDSLVHRGYDSINKITVSTGNLELMESILVGVLNTAFQQSAGEHPLYTNLGPVFQAYWTGATLNLLPPPLPTAIPIPAIHIAQVSNSITNTGTWNGRDSAVIPPEETEEAEEDTDFDQRENEAIQNASNQIEEVIDEFEITSGVQVKYATNFGTGNVENAAPSSTVRRRAGQSNATGTRKKGTSGLSDQQLFESAGGGELWPASGTFPYFDVDFESAAVKAWNKAGGGTRDFPLAAQLTTNEEVYAYLQRCGGTVRVIYKKNPEYRRKYISQLKFTWQGKTGSAPFHVDLVAELQSAFDKVTELGLDQYIEANIYSWVVRNVTDGTRLSNHSWGLGLDMNTERYPFNTRFGETDGTFWNKTTQKFEIRPYDEFDKGYVKLCGTLIKYARTPGAIQWITEYDPMHISLYEGTWKGTPSWAIT